MFNLLPRHKRFEYTKGNKLIMSVPFKKSDRVLHFILGALVWLALVYIVLKLLYHAIALCISCWKSQHSVSLINLFIHN